MLQGIVDIMRGLPAETPQTVGIWVAALLTLAVLSRVLGYNAAFRVAEYLLVGVAAGYAGAIAWNRALWPRLRALISEPMTHWHYALFFLLGVMLLCRGLRGTSSLGNLPLAVLFGTGSGLALGGALSGSLVPQIRATILSVRPQDYGSGAAGWVGAVDAALVVLATIAVFSAFHFSSQRRGALESLASGVLRILGKAGRKVMMFAFGAMLAGAAVSFFAVLKSRTDFLILEWAQQLLQKMGL